MASPVFRESLEAGKRFGLNRALVISRSGCGTAGHRGDGATGQSFTANLSLKF